MSLRPRSRFAPIYRSGTRRRSGGITVFQAVGQGSLPEIGVVAGRNVGNAVKRNRVKRRLREAARCTDLHPNTAYVVVASNEALDARFGDLADWLNRAVESGHRTRNED